MTLAVSHAHGHPSHSGSSVVQARFTGWTADDITKLAVVLGRRNAGSPATYADMDPRYTWHLNDIDVFAYSQSAGVFSGTFELRMSAFSELAIGDTLWLCLFVTTDPVSPPANGDTPAARGRSFAVR